MLAVPPLAQSLGVVTSAPEPVSVLLLLLSLVLSSDFEPQPTKPTKGLATNVQPMALSKVRRGALSIVVFSAVLSAEGGAGIFCHLGYSLSWVLLLTLAVISE